MWAGLRKAARLSAVPFGEVQPLLVPPNSLNRGYSSIKTDHEIGKIKGLYWRRAPAFSGLISPFCIPFPLHCGILKRLVGIRTESAT